MNLIDLVEEKQLREDMSSFKVGDTIKVHTIIREGDMKKSTTMRYLNKLEKSCARKGNVPFC